VPAANRLAEQTSPYLRQHADNPVDWYPWGEAAFAEARRRDVPILLSVGYAACHWCHVMAHESFEDVPTARLVNELTVAVKVDREERPDVDAVYMDATVAMTGAGGWPMTVLLTPEGEPFYAGTYLPRRQFQELLGRVGELWRTRRADLVAQGQALAQELRARSGASHGAAEGVDAGLTAAAVRELAIGFDRGRGGFGGAPKFPPSMVLEFLLRHAAAWGQESTGAEAARMAAASFAAMARGGIYDQLAGGFARYSVDAAWVVPHFEKMLYDNALLLRGYLHLWRATGDPLARRVATETADWMLAELRTPDGGFASSLDADSEGEEGRFYVWTPGQLDAALGPADGARAAELFAVSDRGTFEGGASVLQLPADPADPEEFAALRATLAAARSDRVRPGRDDKVVAAWNGLAVAALAEAGPLLGRPDLLAAAQAAGELLLSLHLRGGERLTRTSLGGVAGTNPGVLEDHGDVAEGLLALHQADGDQRWLDTAGQLLGAARSRFADGAGGFYDTPDDGERLLTRPRDPQDGATPAGASAVAHALLTYAALTGDLDSRAAAEAAYATLAPLARRHPRFAGWALAGMEALLSGPVEVAVAARPDLAALARLTPAPGAVVVSRGSSPLLTGRAAGAAYVCRGFVCEAPTRDAATLAVQLGVRPDWHADAPAAAASPEEESNP
jgi:uncharacterized protein YyaL (SSP411 family)